VCLEGNGGTGQEKVCHKDLGEKIFNSHKIRQRKVDRRSGGGTAAISEGRGPWGIVGVRNWGLKTLTDSTSMCRGRGAGFPWGKKGGVVVGSRPKGGMNRERGRVKWFPYWCVTGKQEAGLTQELIAAFQMRTKSEPTQRLAQRDECPRCGVRWSVPNRNRPKRRKNHGMGLLHGKWGKKRRENAGRG